MSGAVNVIGGGLIGLATAWRAAQAGWAVTVIDPEPGAGASNVAAGMLAPVTEVAYGEEDRLALTIAAARRWPRFADELGEATGVDVGYRATGTLVVGLDRDDLAALHDLHGFHAELGLTTTRLTRQEAREREPLLSPGTQGGLWAAEDHRAEPRAVVTALLRACADTGVRLVRRTVSRLDRDGDRVVGVTTADGEHHLADQVVLAAGAWSATIDGLPDDARPAVRPLKGQVVHLRDPAGRVVLATTVRGVVRGRGIYLVPRDDGRIVLGATQEERGFDTTVTAGGVRELLDDAVAILPTVDELELTEAIAGLRPTTPDNAPIIGPSQLDGLVLATGHHRNGVLHTPLTAETVVAYLAGDEPDAVLAAARPDRPALAGGTPRPRRPALDALAATNLGQEGDR